MVGVSGGADSMALLHALARSRPSPQAHVVAVHVHHGLRGRAADRDAEKVRALCISLDIPCRIEAVPVKALAQARKQSLEEAGRKVRQEVFLETARAVQAQAVVVAHHQDDQVETLLLNLIRGTAAKGLGGMSEARLFPHPSAPRGLYLLRPLLQVPKQHLVHYCRKHRLAWGEDASNQDVRFLRNRIRHCLLPLLEKRFNPQIRNVLSRTAESVGKEQAWLETCAEKYLVRRVKVQPGVKARWACGTWTRVAEPLRLQVLALIWDRTGLPGKSFQHLMHLDNACLQGRGGLDLPGGWHAEMNGREMSLVFPAVKKTGHSLNRIPKYGVERELCPVPVRAKASSKHAESILVDADKVTGRLRVRFRQAGDRMCPLGLQGRHKDIKKIMMEMQIPAEERDRWPLLVQGEEVIWVFRGPMAEQVKLDAGSRKALCLRIKPLGNALE